MRSETSNTDELTLEIEGSRVPADQFQKTISEFLEVIKDVAKQVSGTPHALHWYVKVHPGSVRVTFIPEPYKAPYEAIRPTLDTIETGIDSVESGEPAPPGFSKRAVQRIGELGSLIHSSRGQIEEMRIWRNGTVHHVSIKAMANVDALYGIGSRDWGTLEGTLETISGSRGIFRLVVRDPVTGRTTRCNFDKEIADEVTQAFMRRVSVSGIIHYRRDGEPMRIDVEEFRVLPRQEELPDIHEVRGILRRGT